jgi:hypothetical protein
MSDGPIFYFKVDISKTQLHRPQTKKRDSEPTTTMASSHILVSSTNLPAFCHIVISGIIKIAAISTNSKFLKNFIKNLTKHLTLFCFMLKYSSVKYISNIKSAIK